MSKSKSRNRGAVHQLLRKKNRKKIKRGIVFVLAMLALLYVVIGEIKFRDYNTTDVGKLTDTEYNGEIAIELNYGEPEFSDAELKSAAGNPYGFEKYSKLDSLGRCGAATASICRYTMPDPDDERTSLYEVTPSGWQNIHFWQRCHLIGYQLSGENANERNLITGCNRFNVSGMLPYENEIAQYIRENPDNHVLYRVEPVYNGKDLVARGVVMQAQSIEDEGSGLKFNVFIFNYEPGYIFDYSDGSVEDDPEHQTTVLLEDTTAEYTGENISCGEASVKGSTGEVRYIYYTDREAKTTTTAKNGAMFDGGPPRMPGTYYVRAIAAGDNWYPSGMSNIAKLKIVKKSFGLKKK